jgi:hypothetical protein
MRSEGECTVSLEEVMRAASDLEEFVVAFDQIYPASLSRVPDADMLLQYFIDRDVRRRLAVIRGIIFDSLERQIGPDAADEIGERVYRHFGPRPDLGTTQDQVSER